MELHVAQDKENNIYIVDNHNNLPKDILRSWLMNFPGKGIQVIVLNVFDNEIAISKNGRYEVRKEI